MRADSNNNKKHSLPDFAVSKLETSPHLQVADIMGIHRLAIISRHLGLWDDDSRPRCCRSGAGGDDAGGGKDGQAL